MEWKNISDSRQRYRFEVNNGLVVQQRLLILLLLAFPLAPLPIRDAVLLVHHPDNLDLIGRIDWCHRYVSDGSELTAIVQMFVFQTEKVPYESTEHLERRQNGRHYVAADVAVLGQVERNRPSEAQHEILDYGEVVEDLE